MAQLVARLHGMQKVRGSNPLSSTQVRGRFRIQRPAFFYVRTAVVGLCQGAMAPIYNRAGRVCGWMDADTIRDMQRRGTALISGTSVVGVRGRHLGRFMDGNFRDSRGAVVGWVKGANGGPVKPVAAVAPAPPAMAVRPARPATSAAPIAPVGSTSWSAMTWERCVSQ